MKFLHAADLHLDAQLKGLEACEGAPVERIREATRDALRNLISLALREEVDFVLIAGDLFDRGWASIKTWLWTKNEFARLQRQQIPVYLIRGNHDSVGEGSQRLTWPSHVHEFRGDRPETKYLPALRVALHGQSFAGRAVTEDLAENYPDPVSGAFNIGILHTSLTGDAAHETYAPTTPDVLALKGYDYWALGHIHSHRVEREEPRVVFPGCTQGRHINEPGEKGCVVVTVEGGHIVESDFHPIDAVRWQRVQIALTPSDHASDLIERVREDLERVREECDGRQAAVRIELTGSYGGHRELVSDAGREEAFAEIRHVAQALGDVWVEKIRVRTSPPVDVAQLRRGQDLLGELLRDIERLSSGSDDELQELTEALRPLAGKAAAELQQAEVKLDSAESLRQWIGQTEGLVVSLLTEEKP
jgi:DNA repair exonuclease SbcCD nuclease subunit